MHLDEDAESVHPDADAELEQRPKWAHTTLQDIGDLVGDLTNNRMTRSDFEEPPLALTATKPLLPRHLFLFHCLDHSLMERLLEIPFGNLQCHAGGVQLPPREPNLGYGSPSF